MGDGLYCTDEELELMAQEALKDHKRMSDLYKKDPFKFEAERKQKIEDFINSAPEKHREGLRELQKNWDDAMKESGSPKDRLKTAKKLLFEHITEAFKPAVQNMNDYFSSDEFKQAVAKSIIDSMKKR